MPSILRIVFFIVFVQLFFGVSAQVPAISSFSPTSGLAGSTVTITGSNFSSTASQNVVFFNGVKAAITNATTTQLTVTVPKSASYGPITVVNLSTALQIKSVQSFNPLFDNNKDYGGRIIPASMSRGYYNVVQKGTETSNSFGRMDKGDLDGDGWVDLVTTETSSAKIFVYQNLGTGGSVSAASFSSAITLPSLATYIPGAVAYLSEVMVVDVDSDGKLDLAASTANNSTGYLAVYKNTSTAGSISFANPVFFAYNYYNPLYMDAGDLDGDGKIDFVFTTGSSPGNVFINRNQSTSGSISFSFGSSINATATSGYSDIVIGDLTGDGMPEIVCPGYNSANLSVYQNSSTPGTISMAAPFTVPAQVAYTVQLAMADLDADNKLDMVWSVYNAQYVYMTKNNYSGGAFDATAFGSTIQITNTLANPNGVSIGDINSDGKPDVVMSGSSDLGILQNVGSAGSLSSSSFSPPVVFQGSSNAGYGYFASPAVVDLDGDNKPEVATVYTNSGVLASERGIMIFHNENYPVPSVSGISPSSTLVSGAVALTGDLMYTGNVTPTVRFSKINSSISGTTTNSTTSITVPSGAESGRVLLTTHGLTTKGPYLKYTFGTNHVISNAAFGSSIDFALANGTVYDNLEAADFDDDQKMDFIFRDGSGTGIFQNSATAGQTITISSLTKQGTTYSGGVNSFAFDIDGDGKVDLNDAYQNFQNNSTGSTISFTAGVYTNASSYTGSAYGDFNKDGKIDVALVNASTSLRVFENLSSRGTFVSSGNFYTISNNSINLTLPGNSSGNGSVVVEDFDGDGYDDIITTIPSTNQYSVYWNTAQYGNISASSFSLNGNYSTTGSQPHGITANDFDGDGKTDMAICYYNQGLVSVYKNNSVPSDISFNAPLDMTAATKGYAIASQDIDGDGKADIIVIHQPVSGSNGSFTVFQNTTTGNTISFAAGVNFALTRIPQALVVADVNADQKPDVLIIGSGGSGTPANALMVFENKMLAPSISVDLQPASVYSVCDGATPTITTSASGTTNITYQWQIFDSNSGTYVDLTNTGGYSGVATSGLTINSTGNFGAGTYRCKISGDFATTVYTNTVSFTVNAVPTAPTVSDVSNCGPGSITLTASGGSNGQYMWYDQNGIISGQTNTTYTTPVLSATTQYSVAITNGTCVSSKVTVNAIILTSACATLSIAPQPANLTACPGDIATFTTNATGTTNITFQWQYSSDGVAPFTDISNASGYSNVATANLTVNTNGNFGAGYYRCKVNGDYATTVFTNNVQLVINAMPASPTVQGSNGCTSTAVTLTASGGANGQYRWYSVPSGGTPISGEVNRTYLTPSLTTTTNYYVSINNGFCESPRVLVTATIAACNPPVITTESLGTQIGGKITLDLKPLISTANLDLTSLQIVSQPTSGATASIDANGILTIDYNGKSFAGQEQISIKACDLNGQCATQNFTIDVAGDIVVYNGISPNSDGLNDKLIIQYIDILPDTKNNTVYIFDRWENLVWHGDNYNNNSVVFTGSSDGGNELPSGVYFYKIDFVSGRKPKTGFIALRR